VTMDGLSVSGASRGLRSNVRMPLRTLGGFCGSSVIGSCTVDLWTMKMSPENHRCSVDFLVKFPRFFFFFFFWLQKKVFFFGGHFFFNFGKFFFFGGQIRWGCV